MKGLWMRWGLLLALGLAGCAHGPQKLPEDEGPREYQIGKEDVLDVSVWRDADLSRTVPVRPDGRISLPLVGELEVEGRTASEVAREIALRLEPYVQRPQVVVIVREINSSHVYVIGEVARPGSYPLRGRMTVLQALALAGGPNEFADRSSIVVLRQPDGRYELSYTSLVSEGAEANFALKPGDTIYVP
jgi:polysaccharide export outer membrane protein